MTRVRLWRRLAAAAYDLLLVLALLGFYALLKRRWGASNNEAIQTLFLLLIVAFAVLTMVGVWFRGSGMALVCP